MSSSHLQFSAQDEKKGDGDSPSPVPRVVCPKKSRPHRARAATGHRGKHAPSVRCSKADRNVWKEHGQGNPDALVMCPEIPPFWCPGLDLSNGEEKENVVWQRDEHPFTVQLRKQLEVIRESMILSLVERKES
jgi:hypothetical protein